MNPAFLSGALALSLAAPMFAAELVVTTKTDEFETPSGLQLSLREAIRDAVASGDLITFAPGLNAGTILLTDGQLAIAKNLTIDASSLPGGLTIDAGSQSRIFTISSNRTVTLQGLTLTRGNGNGFSGGAIFNDRATLILNSCTISGNSGTSGGGIYNNGDSGRAFLTLNACSLSGNTANVGGAIYNNGLLGHATLSLNSCTLSGNSATTGGGGIYSYLFTGGGSGSATLNLTNTILAGNIADTAPDLQEVTGATANASGRNLLSDTSGSTLSAGPTVIVQAPRLAPLGHYGGPNQTMPPLANSVAIDNAGEVDPGGTDQRGFARFVNGALDIGAVEVGPVTLVDRTGDDAATATTLRKALADTAATPGAVIRFDPGIFNGEPADTITPNSTQLEIPGTANGLFIDASNITGGVTIDAKASATSPRRVLQIKPGAIAALQGPTLTGGYAWAPTPGNSGGAILNDHATLTLNACTLADNSSANWGGGISSGGSSGSASLSLNTCTLTRNSAYNGGGIHSDSGISGAAALSLDRCTLSGNSATAAAGGVSSNAFMGTSTVALTNTILAGNSAPVDSDFRQSGGTTHLSGKNLLSDTAGSGLVAGPALLVDNPRLAPLSHYGGPTKTMPPLVNSPAINAAGVVNPGAADQRGFPGFVNGALDIGAVELGPITLVNNRGDGAATATTLRKALADTATIPGAVIRFDPAVFNGEPADTISLTSTQLEIPGTAKGLFLDASNIASGITLDADGSAATPRRVLQIEPGAIAALHGFTLTGGHVPGSGGGVNNDHASLTLNFCTVAGNSAFSNGGGIMMDANTSGSAALALNACTLANNH
ncbi:MAG: hypothetical protein K9M97_06535, partial [Akkermansiaceae bacterium]|nr:hypothetical protein [Akkermansiaceae bacterium]